MTEVLHLPRMERYALAAMVCLASHDDHPTAAVLAQRTDAPPAMLAKVLRRLVEAGLLEGERGHHGGYRLARDPHRVSLGEVLAAVHDHPEGATECAMGVRACNPQKPCALHHRWAAATAPLRELMLGVSVAEVAAEPRSAGKGCLD